MEIYWQKKGKESSGESPYYYISVSRRTRRESTREERDEVFSRSECKARTGILEVYLTGGGRRGCCVTPDLSYDLGGERKEGQR